VAFPLSAYIDMLEVLRSQGYALGPVKRYWTGYARPFLFLRHDVDRLTHRAVAMARAEKDAGFLSTFYFRCRQGCVFPDQAIRAISDLGHEVGYHYEVMTRCHGDIQKARSLFSRELASLRELAEVVTVAAHGSPLSSVSNLFFSDGMDRAALGLFGEPQVDFDFSDVFYVTDTGGLFGSPHNRRDWSNGKNLRNPTPPVALPAILHPGKEPVVLLTTHPERWPEANAAVWAHSVVDWGVNALKTWRAKK